LNRRSTYEIVDFNEDDSDDDSISYCKHCLEFGFKVPLKNRIYLNEPIAVDHENWRQCHECGSIVPIYELKKEAMIKDVIEIVESPFDIGTTFLGVDSRTSVNGMKARIKKQRQKELDAIQDIDIKSEMEKGNNLTIHRWQ
jgi:hypothetical protein